MITLTLLVLAVAWLVFIARFPWLFARPRPRRSSRIPRYHYYVCDTQELPTWKRKSPAAGPKADRSAMT
jgi:hypothetical protein